MLDMFPAFPKDDTADIRLSNAILGRQHNLRHIPGSVARTNGKNLIYRQAGCINRFTTTQSFGVQSCPAPVSSCQSIRPGMRPMLITSDVWPYSPTSLCEHIGHVVGVRANEQMIWANACSDIAMVADEKSVWDALMDQKISGSVCWDMPIAKDGLPISIQVKRSCPEPTITGLIDLRPESRCLNGGTIEMHACSYRVCRERVVTATPLHQLYRQ